MFPIFLFLVIGSWADKDVYHLGDLPMQNPDLFEGDILGIDPSKDRTAIADENLRWPGGVIYYKIDSYLHMCENVIIEIMKQYEKNTCLKFVERTTESDYVTFFYGRGCYATLGRKGGGQPLSLGDGCCIQGIVYHEIAHILGILHEQNRSDRDEYINIHFENIINGMERQFRKCNPQANILYNEFDYESIMLYGESTFSVDPWNKKTMTAKKEGIRLKEVHEKSHPTESDYYRINKMYNCVDKLKE